MTTEFDIIKKYFIQAMSNTDLGIGDDAALISTSVDHQLAVSTDSSVVGTHFFSHAEPYDIGWKSLAVNVSDMAAMGATPKWATLALTLPKVSEYWLKEFSRGFFACAKSFNVDLIGGDTTKGPLNIGVQIIGEVPNGKSLKRNGAEDNQDIWVSGTLGSAALALASIKNPQFLL
ncbi:MAG TPA: thiamine-phosphate kinase, partial [Methylophilaceae bacterium]|nr:thiamine-phosphate kinase [Methylophilaceae bacterium]